MTQPLIEASALVLRFPTGRVALDGASLSLAAGELAVVLGANGCGKSTLLRCLSGMLRPASGQVRVAGQDPHALRGRALAEARSRVGMVFQSPNLVRRRSVLANVVLGTLGRHRGAGVALGRLPREEVPHALDCLRLVGLDALAGQRAGTLSGGQAQRTSVARALAQRPQVLLADEPVASLDPDAAEELMRLLRTIARSGPGVLCVLHQPDLARRHADRLIGMQDGRMRFDARPGSIGDGEIAALYTRAPDPRRPGLAA